MYVCDQEGHRAHVSVLTSLEKGEKFLSFAETLEL